MGEQYGGYRVMEWHLSPDGLHVTSAVTLECRTPLVSDLTTGAILGSNFYFTSNGGIGNLNDDDNIVDPRRLEPIHMSVAPLK